MTSEVVKPETSDLRTLIIKAKEQQADSFFFPLYATALYAAIRQSRELAFTGDILAGDSIFESYLRELGAVSNGIFSVQLWISNPAFHRLYEKHAKRRITPVSAMQAALAYDAIRFLSKVAYSISTNSSLSSLTLREGIANIPFNGVTGAIGVREAVQKIEVPVVARDGQFQLVAARQ